MQNLVLIASILVGVACTAQAQDHRDTASRSLADSVMGLSAMELSTSRFGVCDDLARGRLDPVSSRARACCNKAACARLLSTVVLGVPRHNLRT